MEWFRVLSEKLNIEIEKIDIAPDIKEIIKACYKINIKLPEGKVKFSLKFYENGKIEIEPIL